MASRRPGLPQAGSIRALIRPPRPQGASTCPFCAVAPTTRPRYRSGRDLHSRRFQSTTAAGNARRELEQALLDLQRNAPEFVNPSKLQLALQGLRQRPGYESVRIAILGLANGSNAGKTAKELLRVILADPLGDEAEWERQLKDHDPKNPLIVRIGPTGDSHSNLTITKSSLLSEVNISSPDWNKFNLELLFMEVDASAIPSGRISAHVVENAFLVPVVNIPSAESPTTSVTTPVHKSLLVGNGFKGAVTLASLPVLEGNESILAAVDLNGVNVNKDQLEANLEVFDVSLADKGVSLFRQGPQNAMEYNHLWSASNLPTIVSWIKGGLASSDDVTKPAVRGLIASLLQNTLSELETEEARKASEVLTSSLSPSINSKFLNDALTGWAQKAHAELQEELDLAFTGRRWRKLGWWQLFWRVDDVAMLTNEMLSQRFLPTAQQELVYLTGRIAESAQTNPRYPQPVSLRDGETSPKQLGSGDVAPAAVRVTTTPSAALPKWPGHIAFTRRYLQNETIPALQALAQKLVLQSLGTSGLTTSLAALLYVSSFSSTVFEAGAVAALGIMWSFSRLQKKWDAARNFWEGEVREEGRKAVRGAEDSVAEVLVGGKPEGTLPDGADELAKVRDMVKKAEDALARMK